MEGHACADGSNPRLVGDPVDTLTGALVDRMLDFRLTGPIELRWYRHYDSLQSHRSFSIGRGSAHEYDRTLRLEAGKVVYEEPVGRAYEFPLLHDDGAVCRLHGYTLRRVTSTCYHLSRHAQPGMEFVVPPEASHGRLNRLFQGSFEIQFYYDKMRRLVRIKDSEGRCITAKEDKAGRLVEMAMEAAFNKPGYLLISYSYDDHGNLIATKDGSGHEYGFMYDDANRMVLRRGRTGFHFHFRYDQQGRCTRAMGDNGLYGVALEYAVKGRVTKMTRPDRGVWTYRFSRHGELEAIHDPLGGIQKFLRDTSGRVAFEVDANGNASQFVYDTSGQAVAKIDPLGHTIDFPQNPNAPDPLERPVAENAAEYEYGRLIDIRRITLPLASRLPELLLPVDARSLVCTQPANRRLARPEGRIDIRPIGVMWWPEPRSGWIFNEKGELTRQLDEFGRVRQWSYDATGNVVEHVDFDGARWQHKAGPWYLLREFVNPLGARHAFSYTTYGQIALFTDAGGTSSEYGYNLKDHLVEVRRHGVIRETYTRDLVGNLLAKHAGDGRELLRLEIGAGNLPVKRKLASGEEHNFAYDKSGRPIVASTKKDDVRFAYDDFGNRILEKRNGFSVEHRFDGSCRVIRCIILKRFTTAYRRCGDTVVITDPGGKEHAVQYYGNGLVERRLSNGSTETAQFDNLGRCLFKYARSNGHAPWNRRYHWSGESELRKIEDSLHGEISYEYDEAHRLRRRIENGQASVYEMDIADNLVAQPRLRAVILEDGNRLQAANGYRYEYNDRNHIENRTGPNGVTHYVYDSRDQLIRVETPEGVWEAEYDACGRRTRKTWASQVTEYIWSNDQLLGEVWPDGRMRLYIYMDQVALTPFCLLDYDSVEASPTEARRYFIFADQIGTPCKAEDEQRKEVWRAYIEPFGQADIVPGGQIGVNLRFPGHYHDSEIGLHYNRFRVYDPILGRYLQSDPSGIAGGANLYGYITNPLSKVDVRGLGPRDDKREKKESDAEGTKQNKVDHDADPRAAVKELADQHSGLPKDERPNTVAISEKDGTTATGVSGSGDKPHDVVQAALDNVPEPRRSDHHGDCAEINALSNAAKAADQNHADPATALSGSSIQTAQVRSPNGDQTRHGAPQAPCSSCQNVMTQLGVAYNPR